MTVPRSTTEALALARSLGWAVVPRRNGWMLRHPEGGSTMIHKTPSDHRAWRNIVADLRKTGAR